MLNYQRVHRSLKKNTIKQKTIEKEKTRLILYRSIFLGGHCKSCLNGEARVYLFGIVYRHDLVLYMCIKLQVHTYDSILTETHGENEKSWFSRLNDASMLRKLCRLVTRKLGSYIRLEASKEEENKDGKEQKEQKAIDFLVHGWFFTGG